MIGEGESVWSLDPKKIVSERGETDREAHGKGHASHSVSRKGNFGKQIVTD